MIIMKKLIMIWYHIPNLKYYKEKQLVLPIPLSEKNDHLIYHQEKTAIKKLQRLILVCHINRKWDNNINGDDNINIYCSDWIQVQLNYLLYVQ